MACPGHAALARQHYQWDPATHDRDIVVIDAYVTRDNVNELLAAYWSFASIARMKAFLASSIRPSSMSTTPTPFQAIGCMRVLSSTVR